MSYYRSHSRPALGQTAEEESIDLRRREVAALERQAAGSNWTRVWQALQAIAIAGLPIAGFLGIRGGWFRSK